MNGVVRGGSQGHASMLIRSCRRNGTGGALSMSYVSSNVGFRLNGDVGLGLSRGRMPYQVCIRSAYRRTMLKTYIDASVGFRCEWGMARRSCRVQ